MKLTKGPDTKDGKSVTVERWSAVRDQRLGADVFRSSSTHLHYSLVHGWSVRSYLRHPVPTSPELMEQSIVVEEGQAIKTFVIPVSQVTQCALECVLEHHHLPGGSGSGVKVENKGVGAQGWLALFLQH